MTQKYGVENIKKFIKFACDFTKQAAESLKDGWQWTDPFSFVDEAMSAVGLGKSWELMKQEIIEMSPEEKQEINNYMQAEFNLDNDQVEFMVEQAVSWVLSTLALYEMFKIKKVQEESA